MDLARPASRRRSFRSLDLLRGIAAIAVVGYHLNTAMVHILPASYLAVDLFFVLSGFVIAHAYEERLTTSLGVGEFLRLRIIRLYPLYLLGTMAGVAVFVAPLIVHGGERARFGALAPSLLFSILLLPTPRALSANTSHLYPFNFPAWSLLWELLVNIVYAIVVRRLSNTVLVAIIICGLALLIDADWRYGGLAGGSSFGTLGCGAQRVLYSFFGGVGVYRLWLGGALGWVRLPAWAAAGLLVAVLAAQPARHAFAYDLVATAVVFPLLVLASARAPSAGPQRLSTGLGLMSYALYALHAPFTKLEAAAWLRLGGPGGFEALGIELLFVACMMATALAADRYFDVPVRRWLSRSVRGGR